MRALILCLCVCACSGAVSDTTAPVVIQPATATLYAGLPTTFRITGGTGSYFVTSSDQAAVPVSGPVGGTLIVVPNAVAADTPVTLTARDTAGGLAASASLTVKPTTVTNEVAIVPGPGCATVCAGGDAAVTATLELNGTGLANRPVRFEVVSGDFAFITSQPGTPEATDQTYTTTADAAGTATARFRVKAGIESETGVLRVVDIDSGASRTVNFPIAGEQGVFVAPDTITFSGPDSATCSSTGQATVAIFGGVAPYQVLPSGAPFAVDRQIVQAGGTFKVLAAGDCVTDSTILILDSAQHTATVHVSSIKGTAAPDTPPLNVSPTSVDLPQCTSMATIVMAGGTGAYVVNPSDSGLVISTAPTSATISIASGATLPAHAGVVVVSGAQSRAVTVNVGASGLSCP